MRSARRLAALLSGLLLYAVVMMLVHMLTELPSPTPLLRLLGMQSGVALETAAAALLAMPVFALALLWGHITVRPYRRGSRPTTAWCVSGLMLAWLGWLVYGLIRASETSALGQLPLSTLLLSSKVPPLWGLLNTVATLLGVLLAGGMAARLMGGKAPSAA